MTGWPRAMSWHDGALGRRATLHPLTPAPDAVARGSGRVLSSLATGTAAFLLFSNILVVVSRRGGMPTAIAALVPALLAFAVVHRVMVRRESLVVDRTFLVMLLFLTVMLVSAFQAVGLAQALSRTSVFVIEGLILYFLVRNAINSLDELRHAAIGVVLAATLLSALALFQATTGDYEQDFMGLAERSLEHLDEPGRSTAPAGVMGLEDRAYGPVGDPNRFAQMLMMALPLGLVLGMVARSRVGAVLSYGSVLVVLGGVFVTYSRGGFLTLAVLGLLMIPMGLLRLRHLVGLVVAGLLLAPLVAPGYTQRMLSIGGAAELVGSAEAEADGATRGRTTEMLSALAAFVEHPVLGVGPGQYLPYYSVHYQSLPEISIREIAQPRRAHSLYLELGAELGTLGLLVFLAIPILLLRDLRALRLGLREAGRPDLARLAASFSLVLLAYLGAGVFLHLAFERYYWFMVGMTAAAAGVLHKWSGSLRLDDSPAWARRPTSI